MKWKTMNLQTRLYLISAIILLVGLSASIWIYVANGNDTETVLGYEIVGGTAYLVNPENSKKYVHDLQVIGGKSAVFADELSRWFVGLWHGKSLAFTVAFIAVFISFVFFLVAWTTPSGLEADSHNDNERVRGK